MFCMEECAYYRKSTFNMRRMSFRTRTNIELVDDGYKWRKYGKKQVKGNPNSRNYYKCSTELCPVKKRVERDHLDTRYLISTYDGIHNHERPFVKALNNMEDAAEAAKTISPRKGGEAVLILNHSLIEP
ncbi:WRKY domain - like 10 [Theobroma cacao]|nr:WRKY domain - like 10 [Theobroma cacao]